MPNYFDDEQVTRLSRMAGLNDKLLHGRFKELMNLAVSTAIGEPVAWASPDLTLATTCKTITGSMRNKNAGFGSDGVPLYTVKEIS